MNTKKKITDYFSQAGAFAVIATTIVLVAVFLPIKSEGCNNTDICSTDAHRYTPFVAGFDLVSITDLNSDITITGDAN